LNQPIAIRASDLIGPEPSLCHSERLGFEGTDECYLFQHIVKERTVLTFALKI
jgi:hypothetical protein